MKRLMYLVIAVATIAAVAAVLSGVLFPAPDGGFILPNKTVVLSCPLERVDGGYVLPAPCGEENVTVTVFKAVSSDSFTGVVLTMDVGYGRWISKSAYMFARGDWRKYVRPLEALPKGNSRDS